MFGRQVELWPWRISRNTKAQQRPKGPSAGAETYIRFPAAVETLAPYPLRGLKVSGDKRSRGARLHPLGRRGHRG